MKKTSKILCGVLSMSFLLAGCATVGNITNSNKDELIYNGNSAVMVDGYLYYGHGFTKLDDITNDSTYKSNAKLSYLARLNTNIELSAEDKDHSPENVESVTAEVAGYKNSFMFVLGDYIYYVTPKREKIKDGEGNVENHYTYSTLYRSKLNGDKKGKIYSSDAEITKIEVVKHGNKHYVVLLAGQKLIKIQIGKSVKTQVIAEDVTSVAIPETKQTNAIGSTSDWNGYVYYTTAKTDPDNSDVSGTHIYRTLISESESEKIDTFGDTVSFIDREEDTLFYTKGSKTYKLNATTDKNIFRNDNLISTFYTTTSVSEIQIVATENVDYGYVFLNSSSKLMYSSANGETDLLKFTAGETVLDSYKVLFVSGTTVFLSTTSGLYRADLALVDADGNVTATTIIEMTAIHDGNNYAYDGTYIYFYANLQAIDSDGDDETEEVTDENYYLYRVKADVNPNASSLKTYELLSKVAERK